MYQTRFVRHAGLLRLVLLLFVVAAFVVGCKNKEQRKEEEEGRQQRQEPRETETRGIDTPYSKTEDSGKYTPAVADSNHIRVVFQTSKSDSATPCERIDIVQVVQIFADGRPLKEGEYYRPFNFTDTTALNDDPSTAENEHGTHVDHVKRGDGTVWGKPGYNAPDQGVGTPGAKNGTTTDSEIEDLPQTGGGDKRFKSPTNPGGYESVRFEFEDCAYCAKGHDCPHCFECITWVYERTAADKAAGKPGLSRVTGQSRGPSNKFKKALDKFNTARGYNPCHE
jgi:hypothetical protein